MELYGCDAKQLNELIRSKETSAVEVVQNYLSKIEKKDKEIKSYITVCNAEARSAAKRVDERMAKGEYGILNGIPIAVKDNICTANVRTTCASNMLKNYVPTYNAHIVDKLIEAGAVICGKTNLDEFAMGSFGDHSAFMQTKNPLGEEFFSGGSSSGSAAAVAAGLCSAAIGTDTGGSVRVPAAFCGLVGFKPSYGAISRFGLIAYASSLDTVGIIAKNIGDTNLIFSAISGKDPKDMTSHTVSKCEDVEFKNITYAFSDRDIADAEPEIQAAVLRVSELLTRCGAKRIDTTIFGNSEADYSYKVLACAEATSNLARYDGIRYGGEQGLSVSEARDKLFGDEVKRRIGFGNFVLSKENFEKYYQNAICEREKIIKELGVIFERAHIILSPLCDFAIPKYPEKEKSRADRFTVAANFAGIPAVSIPVGKDRRDMPVSVQLMSAHGSDLLLLRIAEKLESLLREEAGK